MLSPANRWFRWLYRLSSTLPLPATYHFRRPFYSFHLPLDYTPWVRQILIMTGTDKNRLEWAAAFEPNEIEKIVLSQARAGKPAVIIDGGEIRGEFLRIFLLGLRDDWPLLPQGLIICGPPDQGASEENTKSAPSLRITGGIYLRDASANGEMLPALTLKACVVKGNVDLVGASLSSLNLEGSKVENLFAELATISRDAELEGLICEGIASFYGAKIGGQFFAENASFINAGKVALRLDSATVEAGVFLTGAMVSGVVLCSNLQTNAEFRAMGLQVFNPGRHALLFERAQIAGGLSLDKAEFYGEVDFSGLSTPGQLCARLSRFNNKEGNALVFHTADIRGGVILDSSRIVGRFYADGFETTTLHATGVRFYNRGQTAASLFHATINGGAIFKGVRCNGEMNFTGVTISGRLSLYKAKLTNRGGVSINLDDANIDDGIWFDDSLITGMAFANNCNVGDISFCGARIDADDGVLAISLDGSNIRNDVKFANKVEDRWQNPATITGLIRMIHARIGGRVILSGGDFQPGRDGDRCFLFRRTQIEGALEARNLASTPTGSFDFDGAVIDTIDDDPKTGWPAPGLLDLDGLVYRAIKTPVDGDELGGQRLGWLKRQYNNGEPDRGAFRPQPFEQLAKVLREQGHDYAATKISIEKRELQRKYADRGFARLVHTILKITSDYGFSPARALVWFSLWVGLGAVFTKLGLNNGLYERASLDSPETSHLEPIVYAFDLATPIIDFGQASAYRLIPSCVDFMGVTACNWREVLEVGYSTIGFVLFSILVLTFSGVLRRDGG